MRVDGLPDGLQAFRMQTSPCDGRPGDPATLTGKFTPAFPFLGLYDLVIRLLSRERAWRAMMLARLDPRGDELIVDAGCGTATFLCDIGSSTPGIELIGVDPDERILVRAREKLASSGVTAELRRGYLRDLAGLLSGREVGKITSSLVFHQVPLSEKRDGLAAMLAALKPGGTVLIADYGLQRTATMRTLFRLVQCIDGFEDTQPNADGVMPSLMREAGFIEVEEADVFATFTGSISIYRGRRPEA